jgi:hypothetical protein
MFARTTEFAPDVARPLEEQRDSSLLRRPEEPE